MSDYLENKLQNQEIAVGKFEAILNNNDLYIKPQKHTSDGIEVLEIGADILVEVASFLKTNANTNFDVLFSVSGVDVGDKFVIVYHLYSSAFKNNVILKVWLDRNNPEIDSLSHIYSAANWHERETFDLFGIKFRNHPDLKRILLPDDWVGHPLRKDYVMNDSRLAWNER
ncbi:MAG: NADH-quinone oxidoreductase subunit C [Candidatus Gastranaerophilales bacterium]|nr:NADH-quinone oxidoreductase subunit C [Candidatus Gastranaerophilales bacterium]